MHIRLTYATVPFLPNAEASGGVSQVIILILNFDRVEAVLSLHASSVPSAKKMDMRKEVVRPRNG